MEAAPQEQPLQKKKLTLTYEEYVALTDSLVVFIRSEEERIEAEEETRRQESKKAIKIT